MTKLGAYHQAKKIQHRNKDFGRVVIEGQIEPDFININPNSGSHLINIIDALNFSNVAFENSDLKEFTIKYFEKNNIVDDIKTISKLDDYEFHKIGNICWLLNNGATLGEHHISILNTEISRIKNIKSDSITQQTEVKDIGEKKSVQDFTRERVKEFIVKIEEIIDLKSFTLDIYKWLQKEEVKAAHVPFIISHFKAWAKEIEEFEALKNKKNNNDIENQLIESYSKSDKKENNFITRLIHELEIYSENKRTQRKSIKKKKKNKDINKTISKIRYKKTDDVFKISSVPPESIIGSEQLWVFNTKTRILAKYIAKTDSSGLQIRGTTLSEFNEQLSVGKRLRKPDEIIQRVKNNGKTVLKNIFDEIKTKPIILTGRINSDTILLRVL